MPCVVFCYLWFLCGLSDAYSCLYLWNLSLWIILLSLKFYSDAFVCLDDEWSLTFSLFRKHFFHNLDLIIIPVLDIIDCIVYQSYVCCFSEFFD